MRWTARAPTSDRSTDGCTNRPFVTRTTLLVTAAAVLPWACSPAGTDASSAGGEASPSGDPSRPVEGSGDHDSRAARDATLPPTDATAADADDGSSDARAAGPSFTDDELVAQGCDLGRATTTYQAGTSSTTAAPGSDAAPVVPCFSPTGFGGQESTIGIARDGTIFVAPAYGPNGSGLVRSNDYGKTWSQIVPSGHGRVQPFLYLDPSTDRLFFATSMLKAPEAGATTGFVLSTSSDKGATWNTEDIAPDVRDWIKIYAGPAVSSQPEGYPNVVYASAPSPISTPETVIFPPPKYQAVYKSLNGGSSWNEVSMGALTLVAATAADSGIASSTTCPSSEWIIYGNGLVNKDGTVYIGLRMCTEVGIAISSDEGATWKVITVPGSVLPPFSSLVSPITTNNLLVSEPLAMDSDGNLYVIWNDSKNALRLSVTKDKGQTWSGGATPVVVSAPGVMATIESAVAVQSPGTIAIAYYGSTDGTKYNGYMAESLDGLDAQPVFASAIVNPESDPLFPQGFDNNYHLTIGFGDLDELVQVKYAPNGDIWATFVKEMCIHTVSTNCTWDYKAHANSVFQGATGRLVHHSPVTAEGGTDAGAPDAAIDE